MLIGAALLLALPAQALVKRPDAQSETAVSVSGMVATVTFTLGSPCSPYTLDWGDGEKFEQVTQKDMVCIQVLQEVTKRHVYDKKGTFEVVLTHSGMTVTKEITVPAEKNTFDLDDIRSVTSLWVDPNEMMADEEYTLYTITLKNNSVLEVNAGGFTTHEWRNQQFVEAGYTGDVPALMKLAESESEEGEAPTPEEEAVHISLQERIIVLLNQIISFLKLRG